MDQFEKFENQLISSYESTLAAEGKEICKEVDSLLQDDEEFNSGALAREARQRSTMGKKIW